MTEAVPLSDARDGLSDLVNRARFGGERVTLSKNGKAVAAVVSLSDLEALEAFEDAADVRAYDEAKAADDGQRFTLDDLRADHEALKREKGNNGGVTSG